MQAAIDREMEAPACSGCGSTDGMASSVHAYRGLTFAYAAATTWTAEAG